jgi:hypothetical protein
MAKSRVRKKGKKKVQKKKQITTTKKFVVKEIDVRELYVNEYTKLGKIPYFSTVSGLLKEFSKRYLKSEIFFEYIQKRNLSLKQLHALDNYVVKLDEYIGYTPLNKTEMVLFEKVAGILHYNLN